MKQHRRTFLLALLAAVIIVPVLAIALSGCSHHAGPPPVSEPPASEPPVSEPPVSEPPVSEPPVSEPPVSEPPVSEPPVSEPPVSEPPVSEPPVSEPPVSEPPVSEPPVSEPPVSEPPVSEPPVSEPPASPPLTIGQLSTAELTYVYSGQTVVRRYYYYVPSTFTPGQQLPLMLTLHGSACSASMQLNEGNWVELAEREGFILIAPEAVAIHANGTLSAEGKSMLEIGQSDMSYLRWNAASTDPIAAYGVDDVAYLCDLIDLFVSYGCTDSRRVYSSGLSHGAFMSIRLAVEAPHKIAGIGSVAGLLPAEYTSRTPSEQVKLVFIHGTADPIVPMEGMHYGDYTWALSLDDTIDWFLSRYGLTPVNVSHSSLPDLNSIDRCTIDRYEYTDSKGGTPVVKYVINNGGHTWPGGTYFASSLLIGNLCMDFQASELIWNELKTTSK